MNEANYPCLPREQRGNELHRSSRVSGGERVTHMETALADQCATLSLGMEYHKESHMWEGGRWKMYHLEKVRRSDTASALQWRTLEGDLLLH